MLSREAFETLFKEEELDMSKYLKTKGDPTLMGLNLMAKYFPGTIVIGGADHDIIYGCDVDELLEAGITEEDTKLLIDYGWIISDEGSYLSCHV